ncbi:AEC family transporter [Paracoccus aerodenitrificans]|uniref:AEC family transporter n=1 Tax=Paracoccus aerodenitrificans TaxID=3017781 RepID=UPI0022EFF637|nr:AEC family transporter [Paracoccus aerodenitrificans]WBU64434.1 AEC family transporter [Paracoccus aerodenitrificans]
MSALFNVVLPVFLVLGFGYVAVWRRLFSESSVDGVMSFAQNFAVPVLLFQSISQLDLQAEFNLSLLFAFYTGAFISFILGAMGARWMGRPPEDCVAIGFVCLFSNSLLLGVPITQSAYGNEALAGNWTIIAVHSPVIYTFGITVMEFTRSRGQDLSVGRVALRAMKGVIRTPLVIGILAGFIANGLMQAGLELPKGFWDAVGMMARAGLPTALFALGGVLFRYRPEGDGRAIAMCCILSLIVHPGVTFGLGSLLGLDTASMRSAVVTGSMPPGVNAFLFASIYSAGKRVAASSVLVGTTLSVLTISVWLAILP